MKSPIDPGEIRTEEEALDQSIALNRIVMAMLEQQKSNNKRLFIALVISLFINLAIVGGFLYYNSLFDYSDTVTTTVDQAVEGDGSDIVNGDQYNDSSTHSEGVND